MSEMWQTKLQLTFSSLQKDLDASAADDIWKHCAKIRNCSWWAIHLFATIFWTIFNNNTFTYRCFPHICLDLLNPLLQTWCMWGRIYTTLMRMSNIQTKVWNVTGTVYINSPGRSEQGPILGFNLKNMADFFNQVV